MEEPVFSVSVFGIHMDKPLTVNLHQKSNLFLQLMEIKRLFVEEQLTGAQKTFEELFDAYTLETIKTGKQEKNLAQRMGFDELIFMYNGLVINKYETQKNVGDFDIKVNDHIIFLNSFKLGKDFDYPFYPGLSLTLLWLDKVEYLMYTANVILKTSMKAKHLKQRLEKHLKIKNFALVHNGIVLSDGDTLTGAGVMENDKIVLLDVKSEIENTHLERLLLVNAACFHEVKTNGETAVGEPNGMRIIHNLDPNNLSGHKSEQSARVCKSLIERIKSELLTDLMSHFETLKLLDGYVHASDLLYDIYETLISVKTEFEQNANGKDAWKEALHYRALQKVKDFFIKYQVCGQYVEPFKSGSFFSYENLPKFAIVPREKTFIETVIYAGPPRDIGSWKREINFPMVKLRGITYTTTIQDVINSYKVYATSDSHRITGMTTSFNNEPANPTDLVRDILGGLFEKNYIIISDLTYTDKEGLDDILEFIEGKKDENSSRRKKKKKAKKRTSNSDVDETPLNQNIEQKPPKDFEKSKMFDLKALEQYDTTTMETVLVNESKPDDENMKGATSKVPVKQDLSFQFSKEKACKGQNEIKNQSKFGEKAIQQPIEAISNCKEKNADDKTKNKDLVESFENTDVNLLTTSHKESNGERYVLETILKNETDLLKENKSKLENMMSLKSKEMKDLLVEISIVEDLNVKRDKKNTSIDVEINDLEARVSQLKEEKLCIEKERDLAMASVQKLNNKKARLENYIEAEMERTASKEKEIKRKIKDTKDKIKALDISDTKANFSEIEKPEENTEKDPKQKLLDFLSNSIQEKENDLECPVCLEIATIPIYSCQESHLICSTCRPKVVECPECRIEYRDNEVLRRHRYAEKTARELERLKEERDKMI